MSPLPFGIMSNPNEYDMDRLHAASSLLSLGSKRGLSPITIETQEPDFNKAIAAVIWSRHHQHTPSAVFKCGIPNCPLCPPGDTSNSSIRLSGQDGVQISDRATSKSSRRSSVVNWLISSSSSRPSGTVSCSPVRKKTQTIPHYLTSSQRSWPAPSSLTGSVYSNSDAEGSRSSPNSTTSSAPYFPELCDELRSSPTVSTSSSDFSDVPLKLQRLDEPSSNSTTKSVAERQLPFSCKFCPKRFAQASNCSSHQRTHTGARPFQCPSCPKAFAQRTSLRTHLRTHTGDRPYCCQYCQQRFGDLSTLTKHRRTHTGERPYRCHHEGCQRAFAQSGNLKRHYKTHLLDRKLEKIAV